MVTTTRTTTATGPTSWRFGNLCSKGLVQIPCDHQDLTEITRHNNTHPIIGAAEKNADFVRSLVPETYSKAILACVDRMSEQEALRHLALLGYLTSSLERQFRALHGNQCFGFALAALPGTEEALLALSERTERSPRDDAFTAWIIDPPFSWTGTDGERRFGNAVRQIDRRMNLVADYLMGLRQGRMSLESAVPALKRAKAEIEACRDVMSDLARDPFPREFQAMRNFLVPICVGGRIYEPPNATYALGWNRADVAIGIYDERFRSALDERAGQMARSDANRLRSERTLPSLAEIVAATDGSLAGVDAARKLAKTMAIFVGVHMGAIKANLPESEASGGMTHAASHGVSGRSISVTEEFRRMRLDHPLVRRKAE